MDFLQIKNSEGKIQTFNQEIFIKHQVYAEFWADIWGGLLWVLSAHHPYLGVRIAPPLFSLVMVRFSDNSALAQTYV